MHKKFFRGVLSFSTDDQCIKSVILDMTCSYINDRKSINYLLESIVDAQNPIGRVSERDEIAGIGVGIGGDRFFVESESDAMEILSTPHPWFSQHHD